VGKREIVKEVKEMERNKLVKEKENIRKGNLSSFKEKEINDLR
jgi:hypothetical protein